MTWVEPDPGEVRASGYALHVMNNGKMLDNVQSCEPCATYLGIGWRPALFEGTCRACECILSGNPDQG